MTRRQLSAIPATSDLAGTAAACCGLGLKVGSGARMIASAAIAAVTKNSATSQPARSGTSRLADSRTPASPAASRVAVTRTRSTGPLPKPAPQVW